MTYRQRFAILKRDHHTCRYCGRKAPDVVLHVDHVIPRCEGGSDDESNLVTACSACNQGKGGWPLRPPPPGESPGWTSEARSRSRWSSEACPESARREPVAFADG